MDNNIKTIERQIRDFQSSDPQELELFRIALLGKKGTISHLFSLLKECTPEEKKIKGKLFNELKILAQNKIDQLQSKIEEKSAPDEHAGPIDFTLPGTGPIPGSRHPLHIVKNKIIDIFVSMGFSLSEGPEIVDDWHNFTALNFPPDHPARDMQDTFFIEKNPDLLLRTHTSSVQVEVMQKQKPPIRTISIGRVYRNESISYKSHVQFHQIEGLFVDEDVSFADLRQCLFHFTRLFFVNDFEVRFRPSYFPFTEPSAEMDVKPRNKKQENTWMEILGCGMVDPKVLENCGIDPVKYSGFAFGMGIERIAMSLYQIPDIRLLYENDSRFLKQFSTIH
jgi:phenylalanyl-tRNA synthetase alpha chain